MSDDQLFWKSLLAGGISGTAAKTITAPLDRVKILFQGHHAQYAHYVGRPLGVFRAAADIYRSHGFRGLFQGHSAMVLRIFPSAAIRFMAYEELKLRLIPGKEFNTPIRHFIAGSLAGNVAVVFTYPLEVIRSRLAFQIRDLRVDGGSGRAYGLLPTVAMIYRENGLRGFYTGFGPTLVGVVPYAGAAFMSYQWMKDRCLNEWKSFATVKNDDKVRLRVPVHLLIGGFAGMLGQTISYPFDTIRHRMQLYGVAQNIPLYKSTWHAIKLILEREGGRSFFRGLSVNYWKTIPANAVAFITYDMMKAYLGIDNAA